ncbi:MAG TPA: hypothetical protein VGS06_34240 [Streptosporangiaceae bacterium]|nr:hypothetical protein [Streptosporangiaceae bacterium]
MRTPPVPAGGPVPSPPLRRARVIPAARGLPAAGVPLPGSLRRRTLRRNIYMAE